MELMLILAALVAVAVVAALVLRSRSSRNAAASQLDEAPEPLMELSDPAWGPEYIGVPDDDDGVPVDDDVLAGDRHAPSAAVAAAVALPLETREVTEEEIELLEASQADRALWVRVVVNSCAYACCGRGWFRREGYEQEYVGWIDNLKRPEGSNVGTFMLYSEGLGTISYVVAVRFDELALVEHYAH